MKRICISCKYHECDPGRACDGRRAYRCKKCGDIKTFGMQGRKRRYSEQRPGYQFYDTGASKQNLFWRINETL